MAILRKYWLIMLIVVVLLLSSCQPETEYDCGIVVGGNVEWNQVSFRWLYRLRIAYPDVTRYQYVDEKTYNSYFKNDVVCF